MVARAVKFDLGRDDGAGKLLAYADKLRASGKRAVFQLVPASRNSLQNDMIYAIYRQIDLQKDDESFDDIRSYCKLHHGVPIMRRDDDTFRYVYDRAFKPLEYEFKRIAMVDYPVTSNMSKGQAREYIGEVIRDFTMQGYHLADPRDSVRGW